ncbi:hypothetical protein GCM10023144_45460 [Pigmentiphaga soli]|uniref:DUF3149 domain-containing protein n=1 Tax=Pigmentiphaga soli TaxID=1007095 RepID=A0ABP8HQY3_9BURK
MEVALTFAAVIAATIGFMYLLIKACILMGGRGAKTEPQADAKTKADPSVARHSHP